MFDTIVVVPRISEFYGIVIEMYFADHPPPHFHARYSGNEALIVIETGQVFADSLPGALWLVVGNAAESADGRVPARRISAEDRCVSER